MSQRVRERRSRGAPHLHPGAGGRPPATPPERNAPRSSFPRAPTAEEQATKRTALATWEADRGALLFERPFLASLALRMTLVPVVDHRVPTACTDGESIWFNPYFLDALSAPERVFVLAHEVWHCALLHPLRRGDRTRLRWNVAIDQEVNALLLRDGWTMPKGGIHFPRLDGLNAEDVYDRLPADMSDVFSGGVGPLDVHLEPGSGAQPAPEGGQHGGGGPPPQDVWVEDPDYNPGPIGREGWEGWPGRTQLVASQLRGRGRLSSVEDAVLRRLAGGAVDWRHVLRDFVTRSIGGDRTWSPPARRHVHRGLYLPSLRAPRLDVCVALDTSASTHAMLPAMLGELHALLTSFGRWEARILWADARVQREERWTDDDPPDLGQVRVPLGGGTDLRPVFTHVAAEPPRLQIYVTDGKGAAPTQAPPWPVLWLLPSPAWPAPAPWGQVAWFGREE